jgi:hypothetical protein
MLSSRYRVKAFMCPARNIPDIDVHKGPFKFLRCSEGTKNDDLDKNKP